MQLKKLWAKGQWDLTQIFRARTWVDGFWGHLGAHLIGGLALFGYLLGALLLKWPVQWVAVYLVAGLAAWWVFNVEEANSTRGFNYPIYAMLWDWITVVATAALCALVYGWIR